jgi:hypothetical protein
MPTNVEDFLSRLGGPELMAWHRDNGTHLSAVAYRELYRDVLVRGLSQTRLLYLDTNYWIRLRDTAMGRGSIEASKLLHTVREMVRSRDALCVIQFYSLLEIAKQTETSLRISADLIDELTEGIVIAAPDELRRLECAEFVSATLNRDVGHDLCAWTKSGQIHNSELPTDMLGPALPEQKEIFLKAAVDACWNMSFEFIFEQFGWDTKAKLNADLDPEVFARVEKLKVAQIIKGISRNEVRQSSFSDMVSNNLKPIFTELLKRWYVEQDPPNGIDTLQQDIQTVENLAVNMFANRSLGQLLPGLAIQTELYVLYETNVNSNSPLTTNDWFDSCHASVALPYCDVFLTERKLAHLLRQELKADLQYDCKVIGSIEEALQHFDSA